MAYRKVLLETLPSWRAVRCFHVGPRGNPVGSAQDEDPKAIVLPGEQRWFVVTWALDGSILSSAGPFDGVTASGALNARGELVTSVRHRGTDTLTRPVLIQGGKVVRDFADVFPNTAVLLGFNSAGLAVGCELIGATGNNRPFMLDVRSGSVRYLDPPPGTINAVASAVNEAGDVVVNGYTASGAHRAMLYEGGIKAVDLGAYLITDINQHRVCSGFRLAPLERAGLLDASGASPHWTEFPLPEGAKSSRANALNDKGQSVVLGATGGPPLAYLPFLWSGGVLTALDDLAPGNYLVPAGLGEGGDIATSDGPRPVLLTPSRPVRIDVELGRPLWELVLTGTAPDGAPSFGVGGVTLRLPNGQLVDLPVVPIPHDPVPGPDWAALNEGQRRAFLTVAISALASRVEDQHAKQLLTQAARELGESCGR